jgi:hypothetical protein
LLPIKPSPYKVDQDLVLFLTWIRENVGWEKNPGQG